MNKLLEPSRRPLSDWHWLGRGPGYIIIILESEVVNLKAPEHFSRKRRALSYMFSFHLHGNGAVVRPPLYKLTGVNLSTRSL
jgi:hypothetical protein